MRISVYIVGICSIFSSCAYKGTYFKEDKFSTRYGVIYGPRWYDSQINRDGRGDINHKEAGGLIIKGLKTTSTGMKEINVPEYIYGSNFYSALKSSGSSYPHTYDNLVRFSKIQYKSNFNDDETSLFKTQYNHRLEEIVIRKQVKELIKLLQKIDSENNRASEEKRLANLEKYYDNILTNSIRRKLFFLNSLYKSIYFAMRVTSYDHNIMNVPACEDSLSNRLRNKIKDKKIEFDKDNSYFYVCQSLTDGKLYEKEDYKITYLHGDPSKVEDKKLAKLMFGDTSNPVSGSKYLENLIKKGGEKYETLRKYKIPYSENKWFRVSMGKTDVYLQVATVGREEQIIGIINPSRGIYVKG